MERLVDLDAVALVLGHRREFWASQGVLVSEFTWRDEAAAWPQPITADRAAVAFPESLGMRFSRSDDTDAELVLWTGGWADFSALFGGELVVDVPKFANAEECMAVAEGIAQRIAAAPRWKFGSV